LKTNKTGKGKHAGCISSPIATKYNLLLIIIKFSSELYFIFVGWCLIW